MPLVLRVLPTLLALVGTALWGYTLVTGRWVRWPIRPKSVPETPRGRRLTAAGMILALLSVVIVNQNYVLEPDQSGARFIVGLVASAVAVVLAVAGLLLAVAGRSQTAASGKQYQVQGWPPTTEPGRR